MSQRSAGLDGHFGHISVPRGWIVLGLGLASWFLVAALAMGVTTLFQALSAVVG